MTVANDFRRRSPPRAFTLVELLVTIAVLALLVGILLPAIQSARESARIFQCKGNLRQIAQGCLAHVESKGYLPCTGRNYNFTCNPDQGVGCEQEGGWTCNLLPFIEQTALFELGAGTTGGARTTANRTRNCTVLSMFLCPNRGSGLVQTPAGAPAGPWGNPFARSDYASSQAMDPAGFTAIGRELSQISDGVTNVFLVGERYLEPGRYSAPLVRVDCNEQGWTAGRDWETVTTSPSSQLRQETPGAVYCGYFGGPHSVHLMAMVDGTVRGISYSIAQSVFTSLADIDDGAGTVEQIE